MARYRFGSTADYLVTLGTDNVATLTPGQVVTCWNAVTGGTQLTDLTDTDGVTPLATLTATVNGAVPEFYGPDTVKSLYFDGNGGSGPRRRAVTTDVGTLSTGLRDDLDAHTSAVNPHGTAYTDLVDVYPPTITNLMAADPFYIAHRGSGDEYPEHTMVAYEAALSAGAKAIEVSCQLTADGHLVCFHDLSMDRVTDLTGAMSDYTYAAVKNAIKMKPQPFYGDGWADVEIPLLRDVLDRLYGKCVIFLEPKSNDAIVPLQNLLAERYPGAQNTIVWKQYYSNPSIPGRKAAGFTVWGYMDAGTTDEQLDTYDENIDIWGIPHTATDTRISEVVARGKPVIVWEIHRRSDVTRFTGLGVQGLMCSGYEYVTSSTAALAADNWEFQVRAPGDVPFANYNPDYALKFGEESSVYVRGTNADANPVFSFCPTPADGYTLSFDLRFQDGLPAASQHADFVFAKPDDTTYAFNALNASGGYHFLVRGNGDIQLYTHQAGVASGTKVGELLASAYPDGAAAAQPVVGTWMSFTIEVTPTQVICTRTDMASATAFTVTDASYRGGYIHLSNGSINSATNRPYWRSLSVS